jgi:hypothetical protein
VIILHDGKVVELSNDSITIGGGIVPVSQLSAANTTSATCSTSSAEPTPETLHYSIVTKDGTSLDEFRIFVEELDGGPGIVMEFDPEYLQTQSYLTVLKPDVAAELKSKYDLILFILFSTPQFAIHEYLEANDEYRAIGRSNFTYYNTAAYLDADRLSEGLEQSSKAALSGILPRTLTEPDSDAPYWKDMIPSPYLMIRKPPSLDPPYVANKSAGLGVTIYIISDTLRVNLKVRLVPHS